MPVCVKGRQDWHWLALCENGGDPARLVLSADAAILTCPMVKIPFARPLQQTAGMVTGIRHYQYAILDRDGSAIRPIRKNDCLWKGVAAQQGLAMISMAIWRLGRNN